MEALVKELIPHAPNLGLYLSPDIPERMLERARAGYGGGVNASEVLALYDATRLGSGGDGALFMVDRFVFQNNNLERPQTVRYGDVVGVRTRRRLLGGRFVEIEVNRGRATVPFRIDFSGKPDAAQFVGRLLSEVMLHEPRMAGGGETDWAAVEAELARLVEEGTLAEADRRRMIAAVKGGR